MQPRSPRRTAQGFTLIEVIVAIVVAVLCLTALAGVFGGAMRSAAAADELARLAVAAESILASAGLERPIVDGSEEGSDESLRLHWVLTVVPEPTSDDDNPVRPPLELKRLTVTVSAQPGGIASSVPARRFELSTLRAVPRRDP